MRHKWTAEEDELLVNLSKTCVGEGLAEAMTSRGYRCTADSVQKRLQRLGRRTPGSTYVDIDVEWEVEENLKTKDTLPHNAACGAEGALKNESDVHLDEARQDPRLEDPPTPVPLDFLLDKSSIMRRSDGTTALQWTTYRRNAKAQWESVKDAISEHVKSYVRPDAPVTPPAITDSDLLVVYPLGDPHIGMMAWGAEVGESFDLKIAQRELCECMRLLVARSPSSKQAIICNLGDFWHASDDNQRTAKSGNKLDVDGRAGKVGQVGLEIFRTLIDTALTKHEHVRVRSIPGNHDITSAFWLPLYLQAVYENDPRVTVEDGFNPYQYDVFGNNLIGWCHGDGAKMEALGEIMATDEPEKWGRALFRSWHTGHVHHLVQKELRGCVVDSHRTLAGRDAWHHHSGYRSGRSLKAIAYHRLYGIDSTAVVGIERVRSALMAGRS